MVLASRSKRRFRTGSVENCAGRILMATLRSNRVSLARYTSPIPPAPRAATISYGPNFAPFFNATTARIIVLQESATKRERFKLDQAKAERSVACKRQCFALHVDPALLCNGHRETPHIAHSFCEPSAWQTLGIMDAADFAHSTIEDDACL